MVINMKKKYQNIGCKLLPKEEKNGKFETWNLIIYPLPNEIGHFESLWSGIVGLEIYSNSFWIFTTSLYACPAEKPLLKLTTFFPASEFW